MGKLAAFLACYCNAIRTHPIIERLSEASRVSGLLAPVNYRKSGHAKVDTGGGTGNLLSAERCKRERPALPAPKEQPPRKLSGKRTARRRHSGKQPRQAAHRWGRPDR